MMILDLHQILAWSEAIWWPFVRAMALFYSAPVFGSPEVPRKVRIGLSLAIAVVVQPFISGHLTGTFGSLPVFLLLTLQQIIIGIIIGFSVRIVFAGVSFAGGLIGLEMGLGFATLIDPKNGVNVPTLSSFMGLLATLVFLAMNGHLLLIAAFARSFSVAPPSPGFSFSGGAWLELAQWGGELFLLGVVMALPVVTVLVAVNIALGVLAKIAPQLNIFVVGFPVLLLIGFAVLYIAAPVIGRVMISAFDWSMRHTGSVIAGTSLTGAAYG